MFKMAGPRGAAVCLVKFAREENMEFCLHSTLKKGNEARS